MNAQNKNYIEQTSKPNLNKDTQNLKKIAYYFGTREPFLINDDGLRNIFNNNGIHFK